MAYLVGQLAGESPVPGGIGVVDGGLIGAMILCGLPGTLATARVLAYHAIALAVPMLFGAIAALFLVRTVRGWSRERLPAVAGEPWGDLKFALATACRSRHSLRNELDRSRAIRRSGLAISIARSDLTLAPRRPTDDVDKQSGQHPSDEEST